MASAVAIAYLARATGTGAALDWLLFAVMGGLGVAHLLAFVDARTPLLVADTQGVRIRLGRTWRGIPWGALARVEHRPRRGFLRDGRLVLVARNPERVLDELDAGGRRQSRVAQRLYGAPFAVPLALSTRVTGAGADLTDALARLAADPSLVVEVVPEPDEVEPDEVDQDEETGDVPPPAAVILVEPHDTEVDEEEPTARWHDPRPALARGIGRLATLLQRDRADDDSSEAELTDSVDGAPLVASATPSPLREPVTAARIEVRRDLVQDAGDDGAPTSGLPQSREMRRPGSVNLVEDTVLWGDRVRPIAREGSLVEPLVIDAILNEQSAVEPADDPVIGPELAAARTRLALTVDQLAGRTRIRPHVIESIEVDDFAPCGGDFYARGHLRTLARVLGIDVAPLLASYDDRYADAPINPRRVFEAELATGVHGSIRGTRGGPNWSVLIAAVMTLVLAWSIARLVMDSPVELHPTPILNGSGSPNHSFQQMGDPVPVVLSADHGGAQVIVRDGSGAVVFKGPLSFGESKTLRRVAPPVRVQSSDGSLQVSVNGEKHGALGGDGEPAQDTFTVR